MNNVLDYIFPCFKLSPQKVSMNAVDFGASAPIIGAALDTWEQWLI